MLTNLKFHPLKSNTVSKQFKIWSRISSDQVLAIPSYNLFDENSKVFVIGSCFANEIRAVLEKADINVYPKIDPNITSLFPNEIKVDPSWGKWDERTHYQCYTPMSIMQEVHLALGEWEPSDDTIIESTVGGVKKYWDPYRRSVYAESREKLLNLRKLMNNKVIEGVENSDLIIITLGLIETHKLKNHVGYACELNTAFLSELEFENLSYEQALNAISNVCDKIHRRWPEKKIVISVSPIPLNRTFSECDVISATMRAKSLLRTVADAVTQPRDFCYYWPSYDYVMCSGASFRNDDLRHVKQSEIRKITIAFCQSFFSPVVFNKLKILGMDDVLNEKLPLLSRVKLNLRKYINIIRRKLVT